MKLSPTNSRALDKAETRAKVIRAARTRFVADGLSANLRDIATAAGVSTGSIFNNFPDKASLYHAAMGIRPGEPQELVESIAGMFPLVDEIRGQDLDDAVDTMNSLIRWAQRIRAGQRGELLHVGAKENAGVVS